VPFHLSEIKGEVLGKLTHTNFLKSLSDRFHLRQHQATTSLLTALMSDKTQSNG